MHPMKTYGGSRWMPPHVLNHSANWKWVVSFTQRLLYPCKIKPCELRVNGNWDQRDNPWQLIKSKVHIPVRLEARYLCMNWSPTLKEHSCQQEAIRWNLIDHLRNEILMKETHYPVCLPVKQSTVPAQYQVYKHFSSGWIVGRRVVTVKRKQLLWLLRVLVSVSSACCW